MAAADALQREELRAAPRDARYFTMPSVTRRAA